MPILVVEQTLVRLTDLISKDCNDNTALMEAAANRHLETLKLLIAAGADVNAQNSYGITALMQADIT